MHILAKATFTTIYFLESKCGIDEKFYSIHLSRESDGKRMLSHIAIVHRENTVHAPIVDLHRCRIFFLDITKLAIIYFDVIINFVENLG